MIRKIMNGSFIILLDMVLIFYLPYLGNWLGLSDKNTNKLYVLILLVTTIYCVWEYIVPNPSD